MEFIKKFGPFCIVFCILTNQLVWGGVSFESRELDPAPGKVAVADIDNDEAGDIVKVSNKSESFVWYKYTSGGALEKFVVLKAKNFRADRIVLVDIDTDGDMDIVSGLEEDSYNVVWLENPLPDDKATEPNSWQIHIIGPQKGYIKDICAADLNGDGKTDIVIRTHTRTTFHFQKQPDVWQQGQVLEHESHEGMDVGDLDGDGDPDIVLNGFWYETPADAVFGDYKKHIFGRKWFTPVDKSWRDNNASIKLADINKDGLLDILISHSELPGFPVSLYTAGSIEDVKADNWNEIKVSEKFDFCQTLDAADIDNDGDIDILAAKFERDHKYEKWMNKPPYPVVVFLNTDGKGLKWQEQVISNDGMYAGIFGDVGGDGDIDIVGSQSYWTGPVKIYENKIGNNPLALDKFKYIQIDDSRDKRYFGLCFGDFTGDGYQDILSGKWFYCNPGGDMTGKWQRTTVDEHIDAMVAIDVDGDAFGDFIGLRCNEQWWYEAANREGTEWKKVRIGALEICDHKLSTQQYSAGQIVPGGKPEIILKDYYFELPDNPADGDWPATKYSEKGTGYALGDVDGDGYLDIAGSYKIEGERQVPGTRNVAWWCSEVCWWKNPGDGSSNWKQFDIGKATNADRYELADLNGDGRLDVVVTEERYPGHNPNASCYWYEQPAKVSGRWKRHLIATQFSMNNLDVGDLDRDGDIDIVTCEHSMPYRGTPAPDHERLFVFENDSKGGFAVRLIDWDKESHLGTQLVDMDGDGDLDIVSTAWRDFQYLHLWRNDAISK